LISKGARGPRSPYKGLLQPFQHLLLQWKNGREMGTLYQVDLVHLYHPTTQLARLSGFYMNELLYKLVPIYDIPASFFKSYKETLQQLNTEYLERALRYFEKSLLDSIGYGIDYLKDTQGQPIREECSYTYHPTEGFSLTNELIMGSLSGASIVALGQNALQSAHLREVKWLLRRALAVQLRGRVLMTRELVRGGCK
jgi:DNA repair protein RecO (recombination protein O)